MDLRIGCASRDITPSLPITTSGFISRCNRLVNTVRDPLKVRCLVFEYEDQEVILLVYDLLGLGEKLNSLIQADFDSSEQINVPRSQRILCCTHTHSAPSTIQLLGCGIPDKKYWDQLRKATQEVCFEALNSKGNVKYSISSVDMSGLAYDRTLTDFRTIATVDSYTFDSTGSIPTTMPLIQFIDENNDPLVGIVQWAAHPVLSEGDAISADYPGELCTRLEKKFDVPFVFLQGAAGNINPPEVPGPGDRISNYVSEIMNRVEDCTWTNPEECEQFSFFDSVIQLEYSNQFTQKELKQLHRKYRQAVSTDNISQSMLHDIYKVLNIEADEETENKILKHTYKALSSWAEEWAAKSEKEFHRPCDLSVKELNLDGIRWYFVAAEPYSDLQYDLQSAFPDKNINIVGYASPMKGYVPIIDGDRKDGYEIEYAYRFYNHPAPFAKKSNKQILEKLEGLQQS